MADTFSGAIRNITSGLPAYRIGENPQLVVDVTLSAYDLPAWELSWHAYLFALDLQGNTLVSFQANFTHLPWESDFDTRSFTAVLTLPTLLQAQDLPLLVQLYGSTGVWQEGVFLDQVEFTVAYEPGPPRVGAYFEGRITRLASDKPSYKAGEYPQLSVDYFITAYNLSYWEAQWYSYLITMNPQGQEIAQRLQGPFSCPLFQACPSPDTRQSLGNTINLYIPMGSQEMTVIVQLYGSTAEWQPWGFCDQREIALKPYVAPPPPPPPAGKVNWPLLVGVGLAVAGATIIVAGKEKK